MVLRQKKPTVKGTTRVSFNDRQLVRKLYCANRNSRQSRQKQSRELSKDDKERLAQAPHRRSLEAFNGWIKKCKQGDFLFEFRDSDDKVAVKAMCMPQWNDIVVRRSRLQALESEMRQAKQSALSAPAGALLCRIADAISAAANDDMPLLTGRKHPRATNYRKKVQRRADLFAAVPRYKRSRNESDTACMADERTEMSRTAKRRKSSAMSERDAQLYAFQSARNLCEPMPRCDYEDCDDNVFYVCHRCNEPVQATKMLVKPSGAFDAFFFHRACIEASFAECHEKQ